jgi:hypothetical protein
MYQLVIVSKTMPVRKLVSPEINGTFKFFLEFSLTRMEMLLQFGLQIFSKRVFLWFYVHYCHWYLSAANTYVLLKI